MCSLKKLFLCVLTLLITVLYSGLPVKAEEQYTVTFDPNGGTMENSKTVTRTSGSWRVKVNISQVKVIMRCLDMQITTLVQLLLFLQK